MLRVVVGLLWLIASIAQAQTLEPRHALIIGNAAYTVGPLANPRNDSGDIAKSLREFGFQVTLRQDANKRQMEESIRAFGERLRKGGIGFFFYAGHAVQNREGRNFLIPVGASMNSEADLAYESVDLALLLDHIDQAQNRLNIVVLDSCRNNPYRSVLRSAQRGLSAVQAATGTFIAYATQPGNVAEDGSGKNSPFTKNLLASLQHPDTDIHRVFSRVTAGVSRDTGRRQVPWVAHSLTGDFYFSGTASFATPASTDPVALELAFWESIKDSRNPAELRAYLDQYPSGRFVPLAQARIKAVEGSASGALVRPATPAAPASISTASSWKSAGPVVHTPDRIVTELLRAGAVGPSDHLIDLGSGDGRIVRAAAKGFGARGIGVEIDGSLVAQSNRLALQESLGDRVSFIHGDLFSADISEATVVTMYLLPDVVNSLKEKFIRELRPGTRVISHDYPLFGWIPTKYFQYDFEEKRAISGTTSTLIYVYTIGRSNR